MQLLSLLASACLLAAAASSGSLSVPSDSQEACLDGRNATGTCGPIFQCPALMRIIENGRRPTRGELRFLKRSACKVNNGQIYLCCAPSFTPPDDHPNKHLVEEGKLCGTFVEQRIREGTEAPLGKHPWMALLFYTSLVTGEVRPGCGGALISMQHVLTAAHCVANLTNDTLTSVRLGEHNLETREDCQVRRDGSRVCNNPQNFQVERVFVHEEHNIPNQRDNDIALLKLDRPVEEDDFVGKICLPFGIAAHRDYTGVNLTVAGFGKIGPRRSSPSSQVLMEVTLTGVPQQRCRAIIERHGGTLEEKQICAGGAGRRDSCPGDSGGPVIVPSPIGPPFTLVGVVSFGSNRCGEGGIPSVNGRVSEYLNWILDRVAD